MKSLKLFLQEQTISRNCLYVNDNHLQADGNIQVTDLGMESLLRREKELLILTLGSSETMQIGALE